MNFLVTITILIIVLFLLFFISTVWAFFKYKKKERMDKNEIGLYLSKGLPLSVAVTKAFSNLNKQHVLGLQSSTIEKVSSGIAELEQIMDTSNVIEIYSIFVYRYIFRCGKKYKPANLSDQKIIYALETLKLDSRNGYFVIGRDSGEDFDRKYPD